MKKCNFSQKECHNVEILMLHIYHLDFNVCNLIVLITNYWCYNCHVKCECPLRPLIRFKYSSLNIIFSIFRSSFINPLCIQNFIQILSMVEY